MLHGMLDPDGEMQNWLTKFDDLHKHAQHYADNVKWYCITCDNAPTHEELQQLSDLHDGALHFCARLKHLYEYGFKPPHPIRMLPAEGFDQIRHLNTVLNRQMCQYVHTAYNILDTMDDHYSADVKSEIPMPTYCLDHANANFVELRESHSVMKLMSGCGLISMMFLAFAWYVR